MIRMNKTIDRPDEPLKVADVMERDLTSVTDDTTLVEALAMFASHRTTGLPVIDSSSRVVGFISEKDVLKAMIPGYVGYIDESFSMPSIDTIKQRVKMIAHEKAGDHMTKPPIVFEQDDDLTSALVAIFKRDLHLVPVVSDGVLVGIVGREDVLEGFARSNFDDGEIPILAGAPSAK